MCYLTNTFSDSFSAEFTAPDLPVRAPPLPLAGYGSTWTRERVRYAGTAIRTDVDAAFMSFQRRGWGIHVVSAEPEWAPGAESPVTGML